MSLQPVKKFQMPIYLIFLKESTRKSSPYDVFIDSLALSIGAI